MGIYKSIEKRIDWLMHVRFDRKTGFYKFKHYGKYIYVRHPRHFIRQSINTWLCEKIYFRDYLPTRGDVVVAFGAGYGEEAIYLAARSPGVHYIGVEPQPVIYECLSNTLNDLDEYYIASPYVVGNRKNVKFISQFSYASVGEKPDGYIEVPTLTWSEFLARYDLSKIDLVKMNIEGAEKELMAEITDFKMINRFVISCHDFRSRDGDGEGFRTKEFVKTTMQDNGYRIKTFECGINWADDWIFAER